MHKPLNCLPASIVSVEEETWWKSLLLAKPWYPPTTRGKAWLWYPQWLPSYSCTFRTRNRRTRNIVHKIREKILKYPKLSKHLFSPMRESFSPNRRSSWWVSVISSTKIDRTACPQKYQTERTPIHGSTMYVCVCVSNVLYEVWCLLCVCLPQFLFDLSIFAQSSPITIWKMPKWRPWSWTDPFRDYVSTNSRILLTWWSFEYIIIMKDLSLSLFLSLSSFSLSKKNETVVHGLMMDGRALTTTWNIFFCVCIYMCVRVHN